MRWRLVIAAIAPTVAARIHALVTDNLPGMGRIAQQHGWVLQLCHFHLLLKLRALRYGIRYTLRGGPIREEIQRLIRIALVEPEGPMLARTRAELTRLSRGNCGTQRIQVTVREFVDNLAFYRAYLTHPALELPHTTNSVESMCRLLREMLRSSRAASNPAALLKWATALVRLRPNIRCNGQDFNRIS